MKKIFIFFVLIFSFSSYAQNCELNVTVADNMNFTPAALQISLGNCQSVTVKLNHTGKLPKAAMGHNWVLAKSSDAQAVAQAGWGAGLANQYLPPGDARIIAGTDIIGGGESTSVTFDTASLTVGGDYTFFCSFVGHFAMMKGKFTVTP